MLEALLKGGVKALGLRRPEDLRRVVCVQPHPDDADVGIGGTVAKLSKLGCEVTYVTMTDDRASISDPSLTTDRIVEIRRKEQEEAASVLGVKELVWLGYPDSELFPSLEARGRLIEIIRRKKPDAVFTVDPWLAYEAHPDHRSTGMVASEASMFSGLYNVNPEQLAGGLRPHQPEYVAYFVTPRPNAYVDVTDTFQAKLEAVRKHGTQFLEKWDFYESYIRYQGKRYGGEIGVEYAEAFKIMPPFLLHYNVDAERM
ncbi:MAG: PIG-L family deacetylase [Candidatus Brockarchaeota archaeon]|nr:PIG-L family deacetylase [Candidatus Brockarchaeota archaeon]